MPEKCIRLPLVWMKNRPISENITIIIIGTIIHVDDILILWFYFCVLFYF